MDAAAALEFIRSHGIVLMSAKGPAPRLVEAIAGEPIVGSWWGHPRGKDIYSVAVAVGESPDVLTCPLLGGKLTFVHRRLWPALVRMSGLIGEERLARVSSEHTDKGSHQRTEQPFPSWVPREVVKEAARMTQRQAREMLGPAIWEPTLPGRSGTRRRTTS